MHWFLYDRDLRHERVKRENICSQSETIQDGQVKLVLTDYSLVLLFYTP